MAKRGGGGKTQVGFNQSGYFGTGASPPGGKRRKRQTGRTHSGKRI